MIALVMARDNSERVPNKLTRDFADGLSLIEISLKKYQDIGIEVLVCTGAGKISEYAADYGFDVMVRDEKSLKGEKFSDVYNFLGEIEQNKICVLNPCFPLIKTDTIKNVIKKYNDEKHLSMITVKKTKNSIFYNNELVNSSTVAANTKYMTFAYESAPAVQIFSKQIAMTMGFPYRYNPHDPELYEIPLLESVDIDTEYDFKIAQILYANFKGA